MLKNKVQIIVATLILSFLFSNTQEDIKKEFDNAFLLDIKFVNPQTDGNDFGINIDVHIDEGYYMSSLEDPQGFETRIEWPDQEKCFDDRDDELFDVDGFRYDYKEDCIQNNGTWIEYGRGIKEVSQIKESKKAELKKDKILQTKSLVQTGNFKINQEYALEDSLKEGAHSFVGQFVFQICREGLCFPYMNDVAPTFSVNKNGNSYDIHWKGDSPFKVKKVDEINFIDEEDEQSLIMSFFIAILAGLIAIVTPCVFPMIPMTVAFFA